MRDHAQAAQPEQVGAALALGIDLRAEAAQRPPQQRAAERSRELSVSNALG